MITFLKDNWFKVAVLMAAAWFLAGLSMGTFTINVCDRESPTDDILKKYGLSC